MKNQITNILFLIILSIISIVEKNIIIFISLILLFIFLMLKLKNKRILFLLVYILITIFIFINLNHNNDIKKEYNSEIFVVEKVKNNYYVIANNDGKFIIYKNDIILNEGNKIKISGTFESIKEQGVPYLFSFKSYCKYQRINGEINVEKYEIISTQTTLRYKIINSFLNRCTYSKERIGLVIFGQNYEEIENFYNSLINLSLIHLFVISGFHFQFLYSFVKKIIKKDILVFPILFIYLYLLDFALSASRAFLYFLLKKIDKNSYFSGVTNLSLIALIFIIINPYVVFQSSFILTFALSFFIEYIKIITKNKNNFKTKLLWAVLPYLSVLPIVINLQGEMSFFQIILQLIITPFIPVIYLISFVTMLIPMFDFYYYQIFLGMETLFLIVEEKLNYISFQYINQTIIIYYYIILLLFFKSLYLRMNKKALVIIYCLCLSFFGYNAFPYNDPTIYFLDVGQGDCILIRGKNNSYNIMIDTGGQLYQDIATKIHIPLFRKLGIKYIDAIFISHSDFDHNGALESLCNQFRVKEIISEPIFQPYIMKDLLIYNLNNYIDESWDDNLKSQVLYFKFLDKFFLCTGDMTDVNEQIFIETYLKIEVDVLKVSHHGSNTSSSEEFLDFIDPEIAVISVGNNNRYGHPSSEVIGRLEERNMEIYRTDKMGTIIMKQNIFGEFKIFKTIIK